MKFRVAAVDVVGRVTDMKNAEDKMTKNNETSIPSRTMTRRPRKPRTWAEFKTHPWVDAFSDERGSGEGLWVYLKPEYFCALMECRVLHEDTVAELRKVWDTVRPATAEEVDR